MSDREFRMLLSLWMCSDPWPLSEEDGEVFEVMLERESKRRGYEGRVDAYHEFEPKQARAAKGGEANG